MSDGKKIEISLQEVRVLCRALDEAADAAYAEELTYCKKDTRTPLRGKTQAAEAAMQRQNEYIRARDELRRKAEAPPLPKKSGQRGYEDIV